MTRREESLISKFTEGTYISLVTVPTISKNHHPRTPFSYMGSSWLLDGNRLWLYCSEGAEAGPVGASRMEGLLSRKSKPRRFLKGDGTRHCQSQAFGPLD